MTLRRTLMAVFAVVALIAMNAPAQNLADYRVLATNKTSTMEKELNEAAAAGYRYEAAMGGESAFGGKEVVVVMSRLRDSASNSAYSYRLLATNKTGTMQKELQAAGNDGFEYKGQTVFESAFGGKEVVVILERDRNKPLQRVEYLLLATNKTSTMEKELKQAADDGFVFVGVTVSQTAFGGREVVSILRK